MTHGTIRFQPRLCTRHDNPDTNIQNQALLATHCVKRDKVKSYTDLTMEQGTTAMTRWAYRQIHSYISNTTQLPNFKRHLNTLVSVCLDGAKTDKTTSFVYAWLQSSNALGLDKVSCSGKTALHCSSLNTTFNDEQWMHTCLFAHKCSISTLFPRNLL